MRQCHLLLVLTLFLLYLCVNNTLKYCHINYFPTQNLLSDAEVTICKYKYLIISTNTFILGFLK